MFSIISTGGHKAYNLQNFVVDTQADLDNLPIDIHAGSTAFVIEKSQYYMLNNQKTWVLVNLGSSGGGSGGIDPDVTVVYEGGEMA